MTEPHLERVVIERRPNACYPWSVVRERAETGETFHARDLMEAFAIVRQAYFPDGSPRPLAVPPQSGDPK